MALWPRRPLWSADKSYTKQQAPDATVPDTGNIELTDLLLPTSAKADAGWVGWDEVLVQVDVDLGRPRWIGFCQAWMLRRDADAIGQATSLTIRGSPNGVDWTTLGSAAPALADLTADWVEVVCTILAEWRYVRFEVATASTWVYLGTVQAYGFQEYGPTAQAGPIDAGTACEFLYHMNEAAGVDEPDYSGKSRTLTRTNDPPSSAGVVGTARKSSYEATIARYFTNAATGNIVWGTALTIMFWLKRAVDVNALAYRAALFVNPPRTYFGWYCGGVGQSKVWWIKLNDAAAGLLYSPAVQSIPMDVWYHFAATYNGAYIRMYVNGNLIAKKAYTTAQGTTTYLRIGSNDAGSYLPDSWIDEVLGLTRVLSEEEIRHYAHRRRGRAA